MKEYAGVWIDFEKAYIVAVTEESETFSCLKSNVEGRIRLAGGSRSRTLYGPQDVASEQKVQERRKHHLRLYYQEVLKHLKNADKILIMGPGKAKMELRKEMEKSKELAKKLAAVESADKMREKQVVARVRNYFYPKS
jgi:hypothetical protein